MKEASEDIISFDEKTRLIASPGMVNCHTIFIFHPISSCCYVAHVNPSQAENQHAMFGSAVSSFIRVKEYVKHTGCDDRFEVYSFDKKGFSEQSLFRLDKALKASGVKAYSLEQLSARNSALDKFHESERERYTVSYHIEKKQFSAVFGDESFLLLDRGVPPLEKMTLL